MGKRYFFDGKPSPSPRRMFRPKHPTVLIALPVAERVCVETVMSLLNFVHHPGPIDLMVNIVSTTVINFARNDLAEAAIKNKADYLAFIDADQVFNAAIHKLCREAGIHNLLAVYHAYSPRLTDHSEIAMRSIGDKLHFPLLLSMVLYGLRPEGFRGSSGHKLSIYIKTHPTMYRLLRPSR